MPAHNQFQVGDMVECQPDGMMMIWVRGTVVDIGLSQAVYEVALESVRVVIIGNPVRAFGSVMMGS